MPEKPHQMLNLFFQFFGQLPPAGIDDPVFYGDLGLFSGLLDFFVEFHRAPDSQHVGFIENVI